MPLHEVFVSFYFRVLTKFIVKSTRTSASTSAVALGPVWSVQDVINMLCTAAGDNGPTWNLWQKTSGEAQV